MKMLSISTQDVINKLNKWTFWCVAVFRSIYNFTSNATRLQSNSIQSNRTSDIYWKIQNFSCIWPGISGGELQSADFVLESAEDSTWSLKLRTNKDSWICNIGLFLHRSHYCSGPQTIVVDFDFAILDTDENLYNVMEARKQIFNRTESYGFEGFVNGKELFENKNYLPSDTLTIRCRIRHLTTASAESEEKICLGDLKLLLKTYIKVNRQTFLWKIKRHSSSSEDRRKKVFMDRLFNDMKRSEIILNYEVKISESVVLDTIHVSFNGVEKGNLWNCVFRLLKSERDFYDTSVNKTFLWFITNKSQHEWKLDLPMCVTESLKKSRFFSFMPDNFVYFACEFTVSARIPVHSTTRLYSESRKKCNSMEVILNKLIPISFPSLGKSKTTSTDVSTSADDTKDVLVRESEVPKSNEHSLISDFRKFYLKNVQTDFVLQAGEETFRVHKCLLASRSYVFAQTLYKNSVSADSNLDPDSLRQLLHFLYTDTLEDSDWKSICNLYRAAHLFDVPVLKRRCADLIVAGIDVDNVCDVLQLADSHQDIEFRSVAIDFVGKYEKEVLVSEGWTLLMEGDVELAAKTMYALFEKKLNE